MYRSKDAGIEASDQEPLLEFFSARNNWCIGSGTIGVSSEELGEDVFLQPFFPLKTADSKIRKTLLCSTPSLC